MSKPNPLVQVQDHGQSIWLDFLSRPLITSGGLRKLIREDGLRGVTSNPKIFSGSISGGEGYDGAVASLALQGLAPQEIYERLAVRDVQLAADEFRELHETSGGDHGFISLEVNPHLAYETEATIAEARRLWQEVARPNVFIKVPATEPGLEAIRKLIAEGINVNVTLLFGLPRYRAVAEAYLAGLRERVAAGQPVDHVHSVASFFLSRIDVLVDPQLAALKTAGGPRARAAARLYGQTALASAKLAYEIYQELFHGEAFADLAAAGARPQRVLWASTSTKNPDFPDLKYVEPLIGPETVNTVPEETLDAYRDHGEPASRLTDGLEEARELMTLLTRAGVDIDRVTAQLEREGVAKFNDPFDDLMATLTGERAAALGREPATQDLALGEHHAAVEERLIALQDDHFAERLWQRDPSLWVQGASDQNTVVHGLGWLDAPTAMPDVAVELARFAREVREDGFEHVVHIGMGGSSLAPLVMNRTLVKKDTDGLPLTVLDTTDPERVDRLLRSLDFARTLFIVASKSGTTTEPRDLADLMYERVAKARKKDTAGENFVAITDPHTPLVDLARERNFRRVFTADPDVGGRYSALIHFGMVPAALMGLDTEQLLARANVMAHACRPDFPLRRNPAVMLGAALGELARGGRDKVTFLMPDDIAELGLWLEQLLAESTGKDGKGLLPVAGEPAGEPAAYDTDRVFVRYRLQAHPDEDTDALATSLLRAGHPVLTFTLQDPLDLAQEFLRWEIATATAGAVLELNPFDQPDVQAAKDATRRQLEHVRDEGELPAPAPDVTDDGLAVWGAADAGNLGEALATLLEDVPDRGYLALLAYLPESAEITDYLDHMRTALRERFRLATTAGYGPRYLHSTGQIHKGGPNDGLFLILTADADRQKVKLPDRDYDLGTLQLAQALGDFEALRDRGRRVVRVHLGQDVENGLARVAQALRTARTASA